MNRFDDDIAVSTAAGDEMTGDLEAAEVRATCGSERTGIEY
jgi:hypothetical protein